MTASSRKLIAVPQLHEALESRSAASPPGLLPVRSFIVPLTSQNSRMAEGTRMSSQPP